MKILIATPAINGLLTVGYSQSFLNTLVKTKHAVGQYINHRDGLVSLARNSAVHFALENNFDKLFFIDADISWTPDQFEKIVNSKEMIIAGAYPYRQMPLKLVVNVLDEDKKAFGDGTVEEYKNFIGPHRVQVCEVANIAAGFMCINTAIFPDMQKSVDTYERLGMPGEKPTTQFDYFHVGTLEEPTGRKVYCTEDFGFCAQAKSLGFKVMWDTSVIVKHIGNHTFSFLD